MGVSSNSSARERSHHQMQGLATPSVRSVSSSTSQGRASARPRLRRGEVPPAETALSVASVQCRGEGVGDADHGFCRSGRPRPGSRRRSRPLSARCGKVLVRDRPSCREAHLEVPDPVAVDYAERVRTEPAAEPFRPCCVRRARRVRRARAGHRRRAGTDLGCGPAPSDRLEYADGHAVSPDGYRRPPAAPPSC
jgi:hypothetical protein